MGFNMSITTNNGIESLNHSLKAFYLRMLGMGSLSSTAHVITQEFIPNQLRVYARENWQMSSYARPYNSSLPKYLHNRPVAVVKHMDSRSRASDSIPASGVKEQEVAGMFNVSSETSTGTSYNVTLGDSTNIPSCSCLDFSKSFLLCKHFFAVFNIYLG